jgi:hypothetical protein
MDDRCPCGSRRVLALPSRPQEHWLLLACVHPNGAFHAAALLPERNSTLNHGRDMEIPVVKPVKQARQGAQSAASAAFFLHQSDCRPIIPDSPHRLRAISYG